MVLEAVYEQDFLPCSYGFRPVARLIRHYRLCIRLVSQRLRWVLDIDIVKYFIRFRTLIFETFLTSELRMV